MCACARAFCFSCPNFVPFCNYLAALENELLREIEPPSSSQPRLQPLENILATMKFTPTAPTSGVASGNRELSKESFGVIDALPDLNFMSAKVLMFPVKGTLDDWPETAANFASFCQGKIWHDFGIERFARPAVNATRFSVQLEVEMCCPPFPEVSSLARLFWMFFVWFHHCFEVSFLLHVQTNGYAASFIVLCSVDNLCLTV